MQKDSMHFSTSGHMTHNQAVAEESSTKAFHCSHCMLIFKSKVYLFEHLNKVHDLDVDTALRDAGLKHHESNKANTGNQCNSSGNHFSCQHCDFKACSQDVLNEHERWCCKKSENQNGIVNSVICENQETKIIVISTEQPKEGAEAKESPSVKSTSKTKCTLNSSKDLKTYKRPLQTITKYFAAASGSQGKPSVNSAESIEPLESTKGTLILQESPSSSSPNSSGVFKVTAKSIIDISKKGSDRFLLNDHLLITDLTPSKPKEQVKEPASNNIGKRTNSESSESCPAKKAKSSKKTTNVPEEASKQQSPSSTDFSFEISEDEEEKMAHLLNGDTESPKVYFCKHCDYSDMGLRSVSTHYQNDHPYIRYNVAYIQDPSDQSATFRCLECPHEFLSIADLKRHYTETHPDAPKVLTMQSCEFNLVFKCFVCPFTTNVLKPLKEHYKEKHPKHKVDNPLLYCRYSATRYQEGSSQLNTCERAHSLERSEGISSKNAHAQKENVKKTPSALPPTHNGADMVLYHCNKCKFSHKSIVVMHVHYQKSHPEEAVTIDKIKQSARAISHITSETIPEKSVTVAENSAPQKNISDSSKKVKDKAGQSKRKISLSLMNLKHTPDSSKTHSESPKPEKVKTAEDRGETKTSPTKFARESSATMDSLSSSSPNKMFYCQFCCYSSTNIRSVVAHHKAKHAVHGLKDTEEIVRYSAEVQRKRQSETEASASTTSPDSETSKQVEVCSEKELPREQDNVEDASMMRSNPYACPENLFYCQKCNFGNPTVKGVLNHQATVHQGIKSNRECILEYTASIRDEIEKSKSNTEELPPSTHLPLPLLNEGDTNMVFCPLCNYRQNSINHVLKHCFKRHRGFEVKAEKIHMYTLVVLKQVQKLDLKRTVSQEVNHASVGIKGNKKMLSKGLSVSASPSLRATEAQRSLKCHKCAYSSQYLNVLRRHMWKSHRTNRSVNEVLRLCFKRGMLESGYHCDLCVFSHKTAAAVYKHHQEQHPKRKLTFEYISTRLYVGPDTPPPEEKKPKIKQTDGTSDGAGTDGRLQSQRSGQSENKRYSCRACSFRGRSMSSMADHYRAVHPWTVKEDGSVLNVITSKKPNANSHVEDHNEMPGSFDTQEVPPEFGKSPGSSHEATESLTILKCHHCPATFHSQRGLKTHCGMKHPEAVTENLYEQEVQRVQIQKRVHIFKCPHCTYVNTNYHGILTHCQMKHLSCVSRADSLHVNEKDLRSWEDSLKRKGPGESLKFSGYMCKTCPQIYATLAKINKHCENDHKDTVPNAGPSTHKLAPTPSAARKILQSNTHSSRGSLSKASFLSKKKYTRINCQYCRYTCSTKIALSQHFHAHHSSSAVPKAKEYEYKCVLCPRSYFRKKRLGNHYILKHGKDAFFKYYGAIFKQIPEKSVLTSPNCPLTQRSETVSEVTESITTTEEDKVLVYMCPSCPYVNASHHGTLTHCQMKHPVLTARADELKKEKILVTNMVGCTMGKGSNERGYMCKKCPQIYSSLEKLKIHGERDHNQAEPAASELSADTDTKKQPHHGSEDLVLEAVPLKNKTSAVNTTDIDLSQQLASPETCQVSEQNKELLYKCRMCTYTAVCRRYLHHHYKNTHKLDALNTYKMLEEYNKRKRSIAPYLLKAACEESAHVKCRKCPNLMFDSSQQLIAHYSTFHSSDYKLDFTVLSQQSKKSTEIYRCAHCDKELNGIRKLCRHLDRHAAREKKKAAKAKSPSVITSTPETTFIELCRQDELPMLETVEELTQWNVTQVETFTLPASPVSSLLKSTDVEQPELESRVDKHSCKQCGRTFMSLKGLRSHERSHAALAAIKDNLPTSALRHNINKYVIYKSGTLRPFVCSICSYRTTVLGLWRCHFMKKHHDVIMDPAESEVQDEEHAQRAYMEPLNSSGDKNNLAEPDEEPEMADESLYLEPPDVQRQLNHYSLMAQTGISSNANLQETEIPENSQLHCEFCNFSTGHLSSIRRHYLNRHGKKILRCKDCNFFTGLRKTLEMHVETGHSTCQSEPTHQKDLRCPFCLYQTKNKNNMIDHIVLHREERVVPIEVRRSKLSRYLRGIVFRCHKCTFTSGSAENLRVHMMRHNDIKPYKCRLCYFDCTLLSDLEAHLSDKHQVVRNHELVGQVSLDQLQAKVGRMREEEEEELLTNRERQDVETVEFVTDCNKVLHETQAENPADNDTREKITLQMEEAYPRHEQHPQGQAGIVVLSDTAKGQRIEDIVEQNTEKMNNADIQFEKCNSPERGRTSNENQAQPKVRGSDDSGVMFTQQKEEAAKGSSTKSGKIAVKIEAHKLKIKLLQRRTLNIEASVEDDILRDILMLDKDDSICTTQRKADRDRTVKIEQNTETDCGDNALSNLPGEESSITLAHNPKLDDPEAKKSHMQANSRTQKRFKVERHLLTLLPNCAQLKISHKESSAASLTNCKEEQVHSEEVTDPYGEMPVLENEYLKDVLQPCKEEEEEIDHLEQKQEKEDEMITEDNENRCEDKEYKEGDRIKEADSPHVYKSAVTATVEAAEVLCPSVTEQELYTCDLCGRNLMSSCELKRHIMRHGM